MKKLSPVLIILSALFAALSFASAICDVDGYTASEQLKAALGGAFLCALCYRSAMNAKTPIIAFSTVG